MNMSLDIGSVPTPTLLDWRDAISRELDMRVEYLANLPKPNEQERQLILQRKTIEAIKAYRSRCDCTIKTAKDMIDLERQRMREAS